jgi:hypothetical protein
VLLGLFAATTTIALIDGMGVFAPFARRFSLAFLVDCMIFWRFKGVNSMASLALV